EATEQIQSQIGKVQHATSETSLGCSQNYSGQEEKVYRKTIWMFLWMFLCSPCVPSLWAGSAGQLFSFGDSGIDNGNVFSVTDGLEPADPYWEGRFSNGFNYLDVLAQAVPGWEATPWSYGGTNAAFGGAQSGLGFAVAGVPNAGEQVLQFQAEYGEAYASSDMILFSMGQNDLLFAGSSPPDPADVAADMLEAFWLAHENGARSFIFPTLFPLQLMPGVVNDASVDLDQVADWVTQVNTEADALIAEFKAAHPDVIVIRTDLTRLISKVYANPEKYGLTNVTDSAYTGDFFGEGGSVAQDSDTWLWWDEAHVTATVQELVATWVLWDVQNGLFPDQSSPRPVWEVF
ncbi:SGNH/GDSL hydrolase family protein, partial [Desulfobacter sp.]|uniref:SGNH/GDSL hydrolase family protein n=1 Tax=Desulfobacter sp. TaxID=2294 RepID=UPI003D0C77E9